MLIADSQVHLWTFRGDGNPWHRMDPTYEVHQLLAEMDEAGVDRAVVVPPMWMGDDNSQALAAAQAHPDRIAVLGRLPLNDPSYADKLADWNDQEGMYGLRFTFARDWEQAMLTDGGLEWLWSGAEKAGLPVHFMLSGFVEHVGPIAEKHPDLKLTVDHLGLPGRVVDDEAFAALPTLLDLAKYPNVSVKATTVPAYTSQSFPWPNTHDHLKRVFDAFGPRRMFWGSDLTRLPCTYSECVRQFTEELDWLKGEDLELVMGRALCDWIGWTY